MADEPVLFGTRRTPSEQDLFDWYMLDFIDIRRYLMGLDAPAEARKKATPHENEDP